MRPMTGDDAAIRWENARRWQQVFDGARNKHALINHTGMQMDGSSEFASFVDARQFRNQADANNIMASPYTNVLRGDEFQRLNNLSPTEFRTELMEFSQQIGHPIPYSPPGQ